MSTGAVTWRYVAAGVLLSVGVGFVAAGRAPEADESQVPDLLAALRSPDPAARLAGKEAVTAFCLRLQDGLGPDEQVAGLPACKLLVEGLIALVAEQRADYEEVDRKLLAVQLLGEMRAAEAVDVLLDNLWFRPPGPVTELSLEAHLPCAAALIRIGEPSVDGILRRADREYEDRELRLLARVVRHAVERQAGLDRCNAELKRATRRVHNLTSMIDQLKRE